MLKHSAACLKYAAAWVVVSVFQPHALQAQAHPDTWAKHVETLLEVAVHTENDPKFLDWAEMYCDSLSAFESHAVFSQEQRDRINQTRDICGDNLNHRAPTLVRWYDSETKKLRALPMKFSSTEDTDMEARLKLSSNAGYTYLALSYGPEDCPLI